MADASPMRGELADSRAGEVIGGRYRLARFIGSGGMGDVYEAEHLVVGHRVAVKFIQKRRIQDKKSLDRFQREIRAMAKLACPHFVMMHDCGQAADGNPYFVMQLLVGETLKELLDREGMLPIPRSLSIAVQAALAVDIAHRMGVIHRDLKPANLYLEQLADGSDFVRILDFGIAKDLAVDDTGITETGAALGTASYMSPEQARGTFELDARSDVYALGAILYEMLGGKRVHPGETYNAVISHILCGRVDRLETLRLNLPPGLADIVHRALAPQVDERHPSAAVLGEELRALRGAPSNRGLVTTTTGEFLPSNRGVRLRWLPRRWAIGATLLVTLVLGGLGGIGVALFGTGPRLERATSESWSVQSKNGIVVAPQSRKEAHTASPAPVESKPNVQAPLDRTTSPTRLSAKPKIRRQPLMQSEGSSSPNGFDRTNPFQ